MKTLRIQDHTTYNFSDNEIVKRILNGEKELYEILVRRNNQKLFRVLRGYLKNEMDVKDAMQETYLKAFEKLGQFNHQSEFSTWLIRIGINEALARLNSFKNLLSSSIILSRFHPKDLSKPITSKNLTLKEK